MINLDDIRIMSTIELTEKDKSSKKLGGPYTKLETNNRQKEVFRLHFEIGYPAVKISEMLHINRNTINSDINFWYNEISKEWENSDCRSWLRKQIQRFEFQRARLIQDLEKQNKFQEKASIEKLIFEIDNKLTQLFLKIMPNESSLFFTQEKNEKFDENEVRKIVIDLIKEGNSNAKKCLFSEDEIVIKIIKLNNCDVQQAEYIFRRMQDLGLDFCQIDYVEDEHEDVKDAHDDEYNLLEFAKLRKYV